MVTLLKRQTKRYDASTGRRCTTKDKTGLTSSDATPQRASAQRFSGKVSPQPGWRRTPSWAAPFGSCAANTKPAEAGSVIGVGDIISVWRHQPPPDCGRIDGLRQDL